ncbi:hypothetical protein [Glycomyces buryatensis]|uniref:Uncharacterized protein n=1 Tax=Glycomyces buryatensis TaxID=2570927 RepID=A0A4S8QEY0_9ACTN|nr:hypothetical protein [Glycomyces buryatensis]THV41475.1 hypothetical protein FAB82_11810 [Glycomyces buryatensis]
MATAWNDLAAIKETFGLLAAPRRLAMAAELLEWTAANFRTPFGDPAVSDIVTRSATAVRDAIGRGASTATGSGLTGELYDVSEETEERGAEEILLSYYLCFDDLDPEIRPDRLVSMFDQCYQADVRRYSEVAIAIGENPEVTSREQQILDYQRALIARYTCS